MSTRPETVEQLRAGVAGLDPDERRRLKALVREQDPAELVVRHRMAEWRSRTVTRLKKQAPIMVVAGVAGFGAGWLVNVFIMGRRYDGFRVPPGSPATGEGNVVRGSIFYFLVSMIVTAVVAYRLNVGKERFWADVRELPGTLRKALKDDGDDTTVHLLVGFAGSMVIVIAVGQSISATLAVGVLLLFGRVLRPVVTMLLMTLWRMVAARIAPQHQHPPATVAMLVGLIGSIGAFVLGWLIPSRSTQVLLGVAAAVGAVILARRGGAVASGAAAWLLAAPVLLLVLGDSAPALADDGGFTECGNPGFFSYIFDCGGSFSVLFQSLFGGGAAGLGALAGAGLGGGDDENTKMFADMTDREKAAFLLGYLREKYPNADAAELRSYYDQLVDQTEGPTFWEALEEENRQDAERAREIRDAIVDGIVDEASFLMSKEFRDAFGEQLWEDLASGKMRDRIGGTLIASGVGIKNAAGEMLELPGNVWEAGGALYEHREELMAAGMDWMANADAGDIADLLAASGRKVTKSAIAGVQAKLAAFEQAALSGDDAAMEKLIGDMAGSAAFDAMLGAGIGRAIEKSGLGDVLKKADADVPDGKRPRGDTELEPRTPKDFERPVNDRYDNPYTKQELADLMKDVKPGQKITLTPEEAEKWSAIEKERLLDLQDNALRYGRTDAAEKPWTELKKGNPDALELRREGYTDKYGDRRDYQPKPNFIENKSMKDWETQYGAPKDARAGEVVAYNPDPMPSRSDVSPEVYERLVQRQKEWERVQAGKNHTSGVMYDAQGRRVMGEARVGDDGRWYTKSQTTDTNGVRPGDPGYQDTWTDWQRTGGDTDTFMMSGKGMVTDMDVDAHLRRTGMTEQQISSMSAGDRAALRAQLDDAVGEAMAYKAGAGTIPGEGRTPVWDASDPTYDPLKHFTTLKKTQSEGVLLVDADGIHLARPGEKYDLGLSVLEQKLRATSPSDWTKAELAQLKEYGITPVGDSAWTQAGALGGAVHGVADPSTGQ